MVWHHIRKISNVGNVVQLFPKKETITDSVGYSFLIGTYLKWKLCVTRLSLNNNPVEYPELMKLLQLRNTFAVTSAEAERVFSSMNRVKRADRSLLIDGDFDLSRRTVRRKVFVLTIDPQFPVNYFNLELIFRKLALDNANALTGNSNE